MQNLADLNEIFIFNVIYWYRDSKFNKDIQLNWGALFALVAPYLLQHPSDSYVQRHFSEAIQEKHFSEYSLIKIKNEDFETVKVQFSALGLVNIEYSPTTGGGMGLFWSLTLMGEETMIQVRTVKKAKGTEI